MDGSAEEESAERRPSGYPVRMVMVFFAGVGLICCINAGSYFWLSSGCGVFTVYDGIRAFGFPFVVFEEGGLEGRREFYWGAVRSDLLIALAFGILAVLGYHFMNRNRTQRK